MKKILFPNKDGYSDKPKIFVLGKFESLHIAHNKLLETAKKISIEKNYELGVMLFTEKNKDNFYSLEERINFIRKYSPNYLMMFEPNEKNFSFTKEYFEKWLMSLNVKNIVVGYDFYYGKDREGNAKDLHSNFELEIIKKMEINDLIISSKNLRESIINSNFDLYKNMVGHYFFYKGIVLKGKGMGKKLLMPTINVSYPKLKVDIPFGIYYSYVIFNGKRYESLTSVSNNPTFEEEKTSYETYIYNFNNDIYGEEVYVEIIEKFRNPIKFDNLELLIEQLEKDKILGKRYFKQKKG